MRKFMHLKIGFAGWICAALALLPAPCRAADDNEEKTITKTFAVEPGGSVTVTTDQGDIELVTGKQNAVEVVVDREVKNASDSQAARIRKKHKVTATLEGNTVYVEAKRAKPAPGKQSELEVHIRVTVPRKFDAQLETAGGMIEATGLQGAIE